jgi:hypothetical protein
VGDGAAESRRVMAREAMMREGLLPLREGQVCMWGGAPCLRPEAEGSEAADGADDHRRRRSLAP